MWISPGFYSDRMFLRTFYAQLRLRAESAHSSLHKLWSIWKGFSSSNFSRVRLRDWRRESVRIRTAREWRRRPANRSSERLCSSPLRWRTGEGGPSAKEGSARRGEWMTSGGWRQHVWDWRVRSTQLGRDRTHSWLRPAFLHKTGLWEKGKIRPK